MTRLARKRSLTFWMVCARLSAVALCAGSLFLPPVPAQQQAAAPPADGRPATQASRATPSWLNLGAAYRFRVEGRTGNGFREGAEEAYGLSRLLVSVGVQPTSRWKFFFQGQDSRAPGLENAGGIFRDPFDVRQAYVEIGDPERDPVRLKVGRQELLYGGQRLVGPLDWTNTARQFDAAKLTLGKPGASVDLFAASVVRIDPSGANKRRDGNNLHGAYGQLNKLLPKTTLEPYLLWKTTPRVQGEIPLSGDADRYTAGFRLVRPLPAGFDYAMEMARQYGSFASDDISAWAGYWIVGYTPPGVALSPRFSVEFGYATGDSNPNDGKQETFDQLFPTGHLYHGVADRVGWQNIKDVRGGVQIKAHSKLNVTLDFFSFWLADKNDSLYGVGGTVLVLVPPGGARSSHIGNEFDVVLAYKPAAHVTVGGGYGYLFPGDFLKQNTPGAGHSFPYLFCNYAL